MCAMGLLLHLLLGWNFDVSLWVCAVVVLLYIVLGGLTSAIYNEVSGWRYAAPCSPGR
jgi:solute:Na+ symporter, SSS family